jgi:catechol 2,3-dioxygenase-like lactoylglutathione lyase family enzyme
MMKKVVLAMFLTGLIGAQQRPRLLGMSHIALRVHDLNAARQFYGDLFGYQEAFTVLKNQTAVVKGGLPQNQVSSVFFKVNSRQYIVLMPEASPDEPRFVDYAIETDDVEAMRQYLNSLGYAVPDAVKKTPTRDLAFSIKDPEGTAIEIMQYTAESLSVQNYGKFLPEDRVSARILHTEAAVTKPATVDFYLKAFNLREFWRADPSMLPMGRPGAQAKAQAKQNTPSSGPLLASLSNLKLPESDDYIEWSLSHPQPGADQSKDARLGSNPGAHIALLVPDMAKAVAFVRSKPAWKSYTHASQAESHVGVNHKWQGNFFDPDGTRTEFMEADTADGLPSPMSKAPYYR